MLFLNKSSASSIFIFLYFTYLLFLNAQKIEENKCLNILNYYGQIIKFWRYSNDMLLLGPSDFIMGSHPKIAIPADRERNLEKIRVENSFWIHKTEVTIKQFEKFVRKTGYKTSAEKYGTSFVFWMEEIDDLNDPQEIKDYLTLNSNSKDKIWWWNEKENVFWGSGRNESLNRPVVHVSWEDADAFCHWSGGRLPTEIEWEYSCRGGLEENLYPWGNKLKKDGKHWTNIWQGKFPYKNTKKDGHVLRSPVNSYPANGFGLYDVSGNVWEWTDTNFRKNHEELKVQKGGSFLCHKRHCYRYRCGARTKGTKGSTTSNLGFRCVADL